MEKKNGEELDYLTVEHNQITFCFAHFDPCYRRSILYAVGKKRFAMRPDCALSVLGHILKLISHNIFYPVSEKNPNFLDFL